MLASTRFAGRRTPRPDPSFGVPDLHQKKHRANSRVIRSSRGRLSACFSKLVPKPQDPDKEDYFHAPEQRFCEAE